jgi:hypothetical protein
MKNHLYMMALMALCGGLAAAAAETNPVQIEIQCRVFDCRDGKDGVLSAPRVMVLEGREATIEVVREVLLALPGSGHTHSARHGVILKVTAHREGDAILLKGRAEVSEPADGQLKQSKVASSFVISTQTSVFVLLLEQGKKADLPSLNHRFEFQARVVPSVNAATIYWQAFSALPPRPQDDQGLEAWLKSCSTALERLHEASAVASCDWGLDYDLGPGLMLPHLSKMRALSGAAIERAKATMGTDPAKAHADLQAALRAAVHVGDDSLIIAELVRAAGENAVLEVLEEQAGTLSPELRNSWIDLLDRHPEAPSLSRLLSGERDLCLGYLKTAVQKSSRKERNKLMSDLLTGSELKLSASAWEKQLEVMEADYEELIRICELPRAKLNDALEEFNRRFVEQEKEHGLSSLLIPAVSSIADKLYGTAARLEAFRKRLEAVGK